MTKEIANLSDITLLVDVFYEKVRKDALLGDIFEEAIQNRWPAHLERMYRFWQTILLGEHTYNGSPFPPHAKLPIGKAHFERWLELFYETLDEHFTGEKAAEAKWRASKMAEMFQYKLSYYKTNNIKPIL